MPTCFEAIHPALSKCGIYVRGCSSTLRINYRTTEEIRKHAIALLKGISSVIWIKALILGKSAGLVPMGKSRLSGILIMQTMNLIFSLMKSESSKLKVLPLQIFVWLQEPRS